MTALIPHLSAPRGFWESKRESQKQESIGCPWYGGLVENLSCKRASNPPGIQIQQMDVTAAELEARGEAEGKCNEKASWCSKPASYAGYSNMCKISLYIYLYACVSEEGIVGKNTVQQNYHQLLNVWAHLLGASSVAQSFPISTQKEKQ